MNYILLTTCLAVFVGHATGAYEVCNKETVDPAWNKCDETYFNASMTEMCKNVECLVKCKKDAVGDCDKREEFREHLFMYDPEKWKVYYRFICSNIELMQQFDGGCVANNVCDAESIGNNFNPAEKDKQALCSSFEAIRKCVSMDPGGTCTAAGAKFNEDIRKLGYSVSICDNTDIKDLYTTYGGSYKCESTSAAAAVALG
ncbi:uncharacterized protein LOC123564907 isoform X2 [Mercenaria mercenaria]|uniref:uncharacterized protein LOC123564907 isoform X2 n=1 Tax=Mercenaria mercenaria TaxID=6596 RepID=UPI001E1D645B|nr:uncharacterized protein LOC123564907 isoform X2 [Mercenaria mercenaria]